MSRRGQSVRQRTGQHLRQSVMTMESPLWNAILMILSGQLPHNQGLVTGTGQDHIGKLWVGGDLGNPSIVALKGATKLQRLGHSLLLHFFYLL